MKRLLLAAALIGGVLVAAGTSALAAWPERPIRLVVPFAAGGTSDQTARLFERAIQEHGLLPQPLTVINVTGHYSIGSRRVLESPADGYNFLLIHIALMGGEAAGIIDFSYRDFEPVASTTEFCLVPIVMEDSPYRTLEEVLNVAKENPDTLIHGANLGAINHMAGIMLQNAEPGAQFRFVQIGGGAENFAAIKGGHTDVAVISGAEFINFREGGLRGLAYTGPERHPHLPEIATTRELGYDVEFCIESWWFAPPGTPQETIDGLAEALRRAMETEEVRQRLDQMLLAPTFKAGDEFRASLEATWERIEPVAKQAAAGAAN